MVVCSQNLSRAHSSYPIAGGAWSSSLTITRSPWRCFKLKCRWENRIPGQDELERFVPVELIARLCVNDSLAAILTAKDGWTPTRNATDQLGKVKSLEYPFGNSSLGSGEESAVFCFRSETMRFWCYMSATGLVSSSKNGRQKTDHPATNPTGRPR